MRGTKGKKHHVRHSSFRRAATVFKRATELEPARSFTRNELAISQLARLGSRAKAAQMQRRRVDSGRVQLSDRVVDLGRYRATQSRVKNLNRDKSLRNDQPSKSGVNDVRFCKDNYVVIWEFPGIEDVEEMRGITQTMFVDQGGNGPAARTIQYSALVRACIVRSFWMDKNIDEILSMAARTPIPKRIMKLQRYDLWKQFNEVMVGTVDYLTDNPDHMCPLPLERYLRQFQAGHLDRNVVSFNLF